MDLANEVGNALYIKGIRVTRDIKDIQCTQSFKKFMESIGNHDIVLMLSLSQNQFNYQINESFRIIFMIRNSIDFHKSYLKNIFEF